MSFSMATALSCRILRAVRRARRFWLVSVFTCTGRNRWTRIICAMPRASFRSLLFTWALRNAFVCRVSMQTAGNPASTRPPNSHCGNGPASKPIRSSRHAGSLSAAAKSSGWLGTFASRQILPASSMMHTDVSLTETSSPA